MAHDYLAAEFEIDALSFAKRLHRELALATVDGLERPWLVIDPRVENTGVVPRLVMSEFRLLFKNDDLASREAFGETIGGGQSDDAATDDGDVR